MIQISLAVVMVGLIYFVVSVLGVGLLLSPLAGATGFLFWRLIDPDERGSRGFLRVVLTTLTGAAIGVLAAVLLRLTPTPLGDGFGVILAVALAAAFYSMRAQGRVTPCVLCRRPAPERVGFDCPRCNDRVCARPTCWNARYARCARCHDREIVIFPIAEPWWGKRLGRRVMKGECLSCYKEAQETDLRECGQCHWPMCKRCWDYNNGVCRRCNWTIPDLPPRLAPFVARAATSRGAPAPKRPSGGRMSPGSASPGPGNRTPGRPAGRRRQ
jgi:hypothetical protein